MTIGLSRVVPQIKISRINFELLLVGQKIPDLIFFAKLAKNDYTSVGQACERGGNTQSNVLGTLFT
jgi:hypothetical protein